jgi:hypothetical protein
MKKYKIYIDTLLLVGLGWVTLFSIFPNQFSMSSNSQRAVCFLVYALVGLFLIALFGEKPADERELYNQFSSSRTAYVVGTVILASAIVWQDIYTSVDPVLPITLVMMIIAKNTASFRK